jgi:hypothetical protein
LATEASPRGLKQVDWQPVQPKNVKIIWCGTNSTHGKSAMQGRSFAVKIDKTFSVIEEENANIH